ncbi:MAG: hypothetical protein U0821_16110 [Chloroflexota bacterium]
MTPGDLRDIGDFCTEQLRAHTERDWSTTATGLDWSCRTVLEHVNNAVDRYSLYLAGRIQERLPYGLVPYTGCDIPSLLAMLRSRAYVLADVTSRAAATTRAYHGFGRPERTGYMAMGCIEMLIHTDDISKTFGVAMEPPAEICRAVADRLFPWGPADTDGWSALRWCTGRIDLPGRARVAPNWAWFASPLSEWDGAVKTQESYRGTGSR